MVLPGPQIDHAAHLNLNNLHSSLCDIFFQCPETECQPGGSRVHNLLRSQGDLCLHTCLALKAGLSTESSIKQDKVNHEFDRIKTIELVTDNLTEQLPKATEDNTAFLKVNKDFVNKLCSENDISAILANYRLTQCPRCNGKVRNWTHKTKESCQK